MPKRTNRGKYHKKWQRLEILHNEFIARDNTLTENEKKEKYSYQFQPSYEYYSIVGDQLYFHNRTQSYPVAEKAKPGEIPTPLDQSTQKTNKPSEIPTPVLEYQKTDNQDQDDLENYINYGTYEERAKKVLEIIKENYNFSEIPGHILDREDHIPEYQAYLHYYNKAYPPLQPQVNIWEKSVRIEHYRWNKITNKF